MFVEELFIEILLIPFIVSEFKLLTVKTESPFNILLAFASATFINQPEPDDLELNYVLSCAVL